MIIEILAAIGAICVIGLIICVMMIFKDLHDDYQFRRNG